MENLVIKSRKQLLNRKAIGGIWILVSIVLLIIGKDSLDKKDWMNSIAFCLIGIIFFTPLVGSDKSRIEICEGGLKIIWFNWIRRVKVLDSEIEDITLAEHGILIKRKNKRPLKIKFYLLDKEQQDQVYKYFTEYAQLKNLVQEKQ